MSELCPAHRRRRRLEGGWVASVVVLLAVYTFVLSPMVFVGVESFNKAAIFPSPFLGFTLHWYRQILDYPVFIRAMGTSAVLALLAATAATLLALPAAFQVVRKQFRGRDSLTSFYMLPLIFPQIVLSISVLQMLSLLQIPLTFGILVAAHIVFVFPFVMRTQMTSLVRFDLFLEEAAMTLGANPLRTLWRITLPVIRPGMVAGFILAFIMSFINLPVSLFLATPGSPTLPIQLAAYMETRVDPLGAAVGSLTMFLAILVTLFVEKVLRIRLLV